MRRRRKVKSSPRDFAQAGLVRESNIRLPLTPENAQESLETLAVGLDSLESHAGQTVKWCGRPVRVMRKAAWLGNGPVGIVPCQICGRSVPFKMLLPDGRKNRQVPEACPGRCQLILDDRRLLASVNENKNIRQSLIIESEEE